MREPTDTRSPSRRPRVVSVPIPFLPSCLESEKLILGALLIEPTVGNSVFGSLAAADFFSTTNTKIFEALEEISREKKNFDLHEVLDRVHENGGELDFHQLEVMLDGVVVSNVDYHVQKVRDAARRREILIAGRDGDGTGLGTRGLDRTERFALSARGGSD